MTDDVEPGQRRPLVREAAAFDPRRPFTRAEGRAAGLTDKVLGGPRFSRLLHGVYVDARIARTPELVGLALLLGTRRSVGQSRLCGPDLGPAPFGPARPARQRRGEARPHQASRRSQPRRRPIHSVIRRGDLVHSAPVQVFVAKDVYNTPHLTVERMARLLRAAGLRDMPRVLRDDWRAHFPVRHGYL